MSVAQLEGAGSHRDDGESVGLQVPELPYVSPSEQDLLDKRAAEEERIRQLLAADNFRELALIEMMDGMLEVRWEDELKKDVPQPKCMVSVITIYTVVAAQCYPGQRYYWPDIIYCSQTILN